MMSDTQYQSYSVYRNGEKFYEVEFPADANNCYWFHYKCWNEVSGFVTGLEIVDEDGVNWKLVRDEA